MLSLFFTVCQRERERGWDRDTIWVSALLSVTAASIQTTPPTPRPSVYICVCVCVCLGWAVGGLPQSATLILVQAPTESTNTYVYVHGSRLVMSTPINAQAAIFPSSSKKHRTHTHTHTPISPFHQKCR